MRSLIFATPAAPTTGANPLVMVLAMAVAFFLGVNGPRVAAAAGSGTDAERALADLTARVEKNLKTLQDLSMSIEIEQINPNTGEKATLTGRVQIKLPNALRLNYLTPDFVAGQVMVIDRSAGELRVYLPVTHEIVVQDLNALLRQQGLDVALGLDSLVGLPPATVFELTYLGEEKRDGQTYRVVRAAPRSRDSSPTIGWQKIWVSTSDWLTHRLEVYNAKGQLSYVLTVKETKVNSGLTAATVLSLPRDATIVVAGQATR
ncbi:MAG TPA: outer membrane lipoprotein carrier protein LolA [Firmicutes bacterium]|nr:outer membrane lipoprotein carrier protein LolA [Bacillota bacterium]